MGRRGGFKVSAFYAEAFLEHAEDCFRWRIHQIDGIFQFEYQEYVDEDGKIATGVGGEWKTKNTFSGLWTDEVDELCAALKLVAKHGDTL